MYIKNREETKHIVIYPSRTGDAELTVDDLERKARSKGAMAIGCHYVVCRDGLVQTGREITRFGNVARKYNKTSVFVCLVGNSDNFTEIQLENMVDITDEIREMYPEAELVDIT